MKTLVKSILPLAALFFAINCFAQTPLPGRTALPLEPSDWMRDGRQYRYYSFLTGWIAEKHYMGAVAKNLTRGKLPTCAYSNTNKSWTNKNKALIMNVIVEDDTKRTLWKSCNMAVSRWDDEGHDLLFTNYPGNVHIPSRHGSNLWSFIYLPLERPDGSAIRQKPKVVDWKIF